MTSLFLGLDEGLARAPVAGGTQEVEWCVRGVPISRVLPDPLDPSRLYAGTLGKGLLRSLDGGRTWGQAGEGITNPIVSALAISRVDRTDGVGAVYVGTEPSALYRSDDGGDTFSELTALQDVPSRADWSFPPAPDTDHVRSIALSPDDPASFVVGIELGGVMYTADRGRSFSERPEADPDPHTLVTHPGAPSRVYEGGGAFYAESWDSGRTWERHLEGIPDDIRYFFSLEVDPGDSDNVIIAAARDPFSGHAVFPGAPIFSTLYRRIGDGGWAEITEGLPPGDGTAMGWLATNPAERHVFYYSTVPGSVYRSGNGGDTFEELSLDWAGDTQRTVRCMAAVED